MPPLPEPWAILKARVIDGDVLPRALVVLEGWRFPGSQHPARRVYSFSGQKAARLRRGHSGFPGP